MIYLEHHGVNAVRKLISSRAATPKPLSLRYTNLMRFALTILLGLLCVAHAQTITAKNWQNHPAILEIRGIYAGVNALIAQKKLKLEAKTFEYCPSWDLERKKHTATNGIVRRYVKAGGSEDSAVTIDHTYDALGRLRFVFIKAGAVNGAQLEQRWYFDVSGKRLWLDRRATGEGYSFVDADFLREMVWNPKKAFTATPPC